MERLVRFGFELLRALRDRSGSRAPSGKNHYDTRTTITSISDPILAAEVVCALVRESYFVYAHNGAERIWIIKFSNPVRAVFSVSATGNNKPHAL
jgi:hypothetical protein